MRSFLDFSLFLLQIDFTDLVYIEFFIFSVMKSQNSKLLPFRQQISFYCSNRKDLIKKYKYNSI